MKTQNYDLEGLLRGKRTLAPPLSTSLIPPEGRGGVRHLLGKISFLLNREGKERGGGFSILKWIFF